MGKKKLRNPDKLKANDPCKCGSEKKYKHCCKNNPQSNPISPNQLKVVPISEAPPELLRSLQGKKVIEEQRISQQGYGRPIISTEFNGRRLVAIGSEIFDSGNCKTFHEVLSVYLRVLLSEEWIKNGLLKELKARHPILQWHDAMITYQRETIQTLEVQTVPATGAISALLGLSYNLYLMAHNSELQEKLINRLKNSNQFLGALYETQVAAICIQAGFDISFENEDDLSSTHCEFTATNIKSGRKFSVEAKARTSGKKSAAISHQLYNALKKKADHERIIFIDINTSEITADIETSKWIKEALNSIRGAEKRLKINGKEAPPAYVFLTNQQNAYSLKSTAFDIGAVAESFKIPDFQMDASFNNLKTAINSRDKHKEVIEIFEAIKKHHNIPSAFDGEIPESTLRERNFQSTPL